jgi:hypothetical protein
MYSENYGSRIWRCKDWKDKHADTAAEALKSPLRAPAHSRPRNRIEINSIDNKPASQSPLAKVLAGAGFEASGDTLILWPSAL